MKKRRKFWESDSTAIIEAATEGLIVSEEQKRLIQTAKLYSRSSFYVLGSACWFGLTLFVVLVVAQYLYDTFNLPLIFVGIVSGIICVISSIPFLRWRAKSERRFLSPKLKMMGIRPNLCLICLYELKGSTSTNCPECGEALAPAPTPEDT